MDERLAFPQSAEPPRFLYGGDLRRPVNLDVANSIILRNPYLLAVSDIHQIGWALILTSCDQPTRLGFVFINPMIL